MYRVFRKVENDESLHVASRDELKQAVQLVGQLKTLWPGQYVIKLSCAVGSVLKRKGNEVWFVTPDQTVYEAIANMAEKGVGAFLVISGQARGHHLGARLRPERDPQGQIFKDDPGQRNHDEPSDFRDS